MKLKNFVFIKNKGQTIKKIKHREGRKNECEKSVEQ